MIPRRPYLIRAMHQWMVDNGETPHLLVDTEQEGVDVPAEFIQDGKIILNISPMAVEALMLENEAIRFSARFGGRPRQVHFPTQAVLAIYARESGQGMLFNDEDDGPTPPDGPSGGPDKSDKQGGSGEKPGGPNLRVIK